jgi:hypothetical protein
MVPWLSMLTSRHPCQARHISSEAFFHNWRYCYRPANTHHRCFTASPRTRTRRDVSASVPRLGLWRLGRRIQKNKFASTQQLQGKLSSRAMPDVEVLSCASYTRPFTPSFFQASPLFPYSDPSVVFSFPTSRPTIYKINFLPGKLRCYKTRHRATWA